MSVDDYERKFIELKSYLGFKDDEPMLTQHFLRGLNGRLACSVRMFEPRTINDAVIKAHL